MPKLDFATGSFIVALVLTFLLLALDKAEKLKGPWPLVLLVIAALFTLPLALSPSIVADAQGLTKVFRVLAAICVVGFVYAGLAAWITTPEPEPQPQPSVQAIRVQYSSTQTVEVSSESGRYNQTINLDNVATLVQLWTWTLDEVVMYLVQSPPLSVKKPKAGEEYRVHEDGTAFVFNPDKVPGIEMKDAVMYSGETEYLFNRFTSPSHIIQVSERRFKVTLQSVRDKSTKKKKHIEYTFGISELDPVRV